MPDEQGICHGCGQLIEGLAHTDPPCKKCELQKHKDQYQPPKTNYQSTLDFIDQLRARGVIQFVGLGLNLTLDSHFTLGEVARATEPAKPEIVNIEGIEMDKKLADDLFGPGQT